MEQSVARPKRRLSTLFLVVLFVGACLGIWQAQAIEDWYRLQGYDAPDKVAQLADDTTMTDYARKLYYINRPELITKASFATYCPAGTEQTVVLGCYTSGDRGIFLLDVENDELDGVEQVTAAHEMLHAAYERLSGSERQKIDGLLEDFYANGLNNNTVKDVVDSYKQSEPDHLADEMHSIFATQVKELPVELERHYNRYFTNRQTVVNYYLEYEAAFTSRQKRIEGYDAQLTAWKSEIDLRDKEIKDSRDELQRKNEQLNLYRSNGRYDAYNAGVDEYNALVASYNAKLKALQSLISKYNATVEMRNDIAFEERALVQAISATPIEQ